MHKHLTISSTNKQGVSIDLIFVLCSPTELTNTPVVGPTQYFIAVGPTQSNKYKHIRQSFSNYMAAPVSLLQVLQSLTKNIQEKPIEECSMSTKQTVSPMKCSVTQVSSGGSILGQGEGLGKFIFCQVPTHGGDANERNRGQFATLEIYAG